MKVVLAMDLGTTGNRVIAFSKQGKPVAKSYYEFPQIFPKPGWVEHNPVDIWNTARKALQDVIKKTGARSIVSIGITNQRETTVLWNKKTGKPVYNAIVWQDRRTAPMCKKMQKYSDIVRKKTGLFIDPYFSATKIKWIIENVKGVKQEIEKGNILFGTIDAWILWNLTNGKVHATEPSNASRTMLFNIHSLSYDRQLLDLFKVPSNILPEVKQSSDDFGKTEKSITSAEIPITGILGDQQASLFAQGGWEKGVVKNTYGTGLFLMALTADRVLPGKNRLINTIAWSIDNKASYAVEGSIFVGGSCIQWLRDGLKVIKESSETEGMAKSLSSNEGVYFVPALTGLGAPYWDSCARGLIIGITRGTKKEHLVRAALEGIAYQVKDVVNEMGKEASVKFRKLRVDGGAAKNNFLMQFQVDMLNFPIERPVGIETTALGAAAISGIGSGFWTREEFFKTRKIDKIFLPKMDAKKRDYYYARWKDAVKRALNWER